MPSEVQILKESKARFEDVIFKQTADLGTNKSTSCKVIDEATGEVIAQSGGGGGESAEVSFAHITLNITAPEGVTIDYHYLPEVSFSYGEMPRETTYIANAYTDENNVVKVAMYNGVAVAAPTVMGLVSEGEEYAIAEGYTLEGGISYDESNECFVITGDGTITGQYASE